VSTEVIIQVSAHAESAPTCSRQLPVRAIAERQNNVVHWSEFDRGGHFAALEAPDLLVGDIREFFRKLR
jgi:pimeloyl-ACP methyl ester carboxylesterase